MGRTLKRVPMDFDHPMKEVWPGYLSEGFPQCGDCGGEGYGPEARAVASTFYPHQIGGRSADALAWCDKIGQAEVDNLLARGRLRTWRDGAWHADPRTAAEVNAEQRSRGQGFTGHDGVNRWVLIDFRCGQLGIVRECPTCGGHGDLASDAERSKADEWEPTEPPEGEGFQLWETTSEGSPVSPVFATMEALCDYAAANCTVFGSARSTAGEWQSMLDEDFVRVETVDGDGNRAVFL